MNQRITCCFFYTLHTVIPKPISISLATLDDSFLFCSETCLAFKVSLHQEESWLPMFFLTGEKQAKGFCGGAGCKCAFKHRVAWGRDKRNNN